MTRTIGKRFLSVFAALVLLITLVPINTVSASTISYTESATVSFNNETFFHLKTSKSKPVTIVYSISGNDNTRYTVNIVTPIGVSYTDKIYANGGKKAKTFSSGGPGNYYITITLYSGSSSRVTANVYTY